MSRLSITSHGAVFVTDTIRRKYVYDRSENKLLSAHVLCKIIDGRINWHWELNECEMLPIGILYKRIYDELSCNDTKWRYILITLLIRTKSVANIKIKNEFDGCDYIVALYESDRTFYDLENDRENFNLLYKCHYKCIFYGIKIHHSYKRG